MAKSIKSALAELCDGEMCIIEIDGKEWEVIWSANDYQFLSNNPRMPGHFKSEDVSAWRSASIKF
jgi:galactose-1-phosphate uridylyltransferase